MFNTYPSPPPFQKKRGGGGENIWDFSIKFRSESRVHCNHAITNYAEYINIFLICSIIAHTIITPRSILPDTKFDTTDDLNWGEK